MRLAHGAAGVGVGFLLACGGSLAQVPVRSVVATFDKPQGVCAGESVNLKVVAHTTAGEQLEVGIFDDISWSDFQVTPQVGSFNMGIWTLPEDPMALWSLDAAHLDVLPIHHAQLKSSLRLPIRWDCPILKSWRGRDGWDGSDGITELLGDDGRPGEDGEDGDDLSLKVHAEMQRTPYGLDLAVVQVTAGAQMSTYAYDPKATNLRIDAYGGDGGDGGDGADAQRDSIRDAGDGGDGGNGGNGGRVIYEEDLDESFLPYAHTLVVSRRSGSGGKAGKAGRGGRGERLFDSDGLGGRPGQPGITPAN